MDRDQRAISEWYPKLLRDNLVVSLAVFQGRSSPSIRKAPSGPLGTKRALTTDELALSIETPDVRPKGMLVDDRIVVVDADPRWAAEYERTAAMIRGVLPKSLMLDIEHFGSTSVPGCDAKPIIDVALVPRDPADWPTIEATLPALGFPLWEENPDHDRRLFIGRSPQDGQRTHHIHLRKPHDIRSELAFRDILRRDSSVRDAYVKLKHHLASRHGNDRIAYSDGKTGFILKTLEQAPKS